MDSLILRRYPRRYSVGFLWAIAFWIGFGHCSTAGADSAFAYVTGLSFLTDPQGKETIETISRPARARDFKPAPNGFSAGYTRHVHWLRFALAAPPEQDGQRSLLVEFYPPFLDNLQVFVSRPDGHGFDRHDYGDLRPFSERSIHHRAFVQRIEFFDERPVQVYVRLQTTSSSVLAVKALTPRQFIDDTEEEYAFLGVFFCLLVAGLLANIRYAFHGDPLQRAFLVHLTTTLFMTFATNGLFAEYFFQDSPLWADRSTSISSMLVVVSGTFFYGKVLDMENAPRWMRMIYRLVFWLGILFLPSLFLDIYTEAQRVLIFGALVVLLIGIWRSIQLLQGNAWGSLLILLGLVCSLLGASAATLTLLGVLPGQLWLVHSYTVSTLGTLATLQAWFMWRTRMNEAGLIEARMAVERAAAVLEVERASREAQRRFLAMLTHELKTPLSALRLCLWQMTKPGSLRDHAENSIAQIDTIIERCDLMSRFDDGRLEVTKVPCSLHELVADMVVQRAGSERIVLDIPHSPPLMMKTDPTLLRTILENLTSNALKYSPAQMKISLSASPQIKDDRPGVCIRVENPVAGQSMRPDPEQVFAKYYRAPEAQKSTGSGLGLYIVHGLSAMLGGDARYLSDQTNVVFEIWIPA